MEHRRISSERSLQLNCSCGAKLSNIPFKPVFIFKKLSGSWVDTVVSGLIGKESKTQKVRAEQLNRFNQAIRKYEPNVGAWCAKTKEAFERTEWVIIHKKYSVSKVKGMRGADFEDFLQVLFRKIGYSVQKTRPPNDQGADLILIDKAGTRIAVQAKRHAAPVGNRAVQEIIAGMRFHSCSKGMVVTTSRFTDAAMALAAKAAEISLWNYPKLEEICAPLFAEEVPPFRRDEYIRLKTLLKEQRLLPAPRRRFRRKYR